MRVLVYGASVTQGFWDSQGGWVQRLRSHYDKLYLKHSDQDQPTIFNLGISGDTASKLVQRFEAETEARVWPTEDFAFIFSIGTNDAAIKGSDEEFSNTERFRNDLETLVKMAKKYSPKIMFVGLVACEEAKTRPVAWADVTYTNDRLFLFDKVMRDVAFEHHLPHVALFETFEDQLAAGQKLHVDGLHPNDEGHQLIFELVQPVLDQLLD